MFQTVFSVHYQELKTAHTASDQYLTLYVQFETSDDGQKNPSETCRASYRNKEIVKRCILLVLLCEYPKILLTETALTAKFHYVNNVRTSCPWF